MADREIRALKWFYSRDHHIISSFSSFFVLNTPFQKRTTFAFSPEQVYKPETLLDILLNSFIRKKKITVYFCMKTVITANTHHIFPNWRICKFIKCGCGRSSMFKSCLNPLHKFPKGPPGFAFLHLIKT